MTISLPDTNVLRELLEYNSDTGVLTWRNRSPDILENVKRANLWNANWAGKNAGSVHKGSGYWVICIFFTRYYAHRIAWKIHHGEEPPLEIDHINNNKLDNRISNLRAATASQNRRNKGKYKNNTSGFKGIFRFRNKWRAQIRVNKKQIFLGCFATPEAAHAAYCSAANKYHGDFANHG